MISSAQNAHLKLVRKLAQRRGRQQEGAFVAEGEDLVLAGIECGWTPRFLLVDADRMPDIDAAGAGCEVLPVEPELLAAVSELGHPPRVIGVFDVPATGAEQVLEETRSGYPVLLLDAIADPGNLGTILRSAAALGSSGVLLGSGCTDPYGGKAVRASMGAIFRIPVASVADVQSHRLHDLIDETILRAHEGSQIVALAADGDRTIRESADVAHSNGVVIIVGNERDGISEELHRIANHTASIPQDAAVDSVNAAVAASIALYEFAQARSEQPA